jgi:preprotein translocase subunit SecF
MDISNIKYYKFAEKKFLWLGISTIAILLGLSCMIYRGVTHQPILNLGIDFTGGMSILVRFDNFDTAIKQAQIKKENTRNIQVKFISQVRDVLKEFNLDQSRIQATQDNEIMIRTQGISVVQRERILEQMKAKLGNLTLLEAYEIGPTIGAELKEKALWIVFICSMAILLYITWRFEFMFGFAALVALLHDALFTLSFASICFIEIDTAFIAAILTILGYSINDTIVVYDRIRENMALTKKNLDFTALVNISTMQVFRRSMYTSTTTLIALTPLMLFGGTTIKGFALILFAGIISGTYSSIFIAIPVLVMLAPKQNAGN